MSVILKSLTRNVGDRMAHYKDNILINITAGIFPQIVAHLKSTAPGNSFVHVQHCARWLLEHCSDGLLYGWNTT